MKDNPDHTEEKLFENLDYYLDIAYRDMLWRAGHTSKIKAGQSPLLWVYGGIARLNPDDDLSSIVYGGYMTVSLGYSGLYECVYYITKCGHWELKGKNLALKILKYLNKRNEEFGEKAGLSVGLYGTPQETLTDKFARACIRDFGHIGDDSQRHYETNSYHVPVFHKLNAFDKLNIEAEYSDLSTGGSISYVEVPNLSNNIDAVLEIIEHIGNTCLYAEINSEISTCKTCGFNGYDFEKVMADDGTVRWKCPCCGESDPANVKTSYRICGYISNYTPNQGRSEDIMNRVKHLNMDF